jgi:hypothetical protein
VPELTCRNFNLFLIEKSIKMKTMFMKLGGRKSREQLQPNVNRSFDEKTFTATVDLLEIFTKKAATDGTFGNVCEAPAKDIDSVISSVFNGKFSFKHLRKSLVIL